MSTRLLRNCAIASFFIAMGIILFGGYVAKDRVAPYPDMAASGGGTVLSQRDILDGQDVYQRYGLMDHGTLWGTGTYRGMDFSADTLHRIGTHMRDFYAAWQTGTPPADGAYSRLPDEKKWLIDAQVINEIKHNAYDAATNAVALTDGQVYALGEIRRYWDKEFGEGDTRVGFLPNTIGDTVERRHIADFFFWSAWVASCPRANGGPPSDRVSFTNNWPADASVGNVAPPQAMIATVGSILAFMGVLGFVVYIIHRYRFFYGDAKGVEAAYRLMRAITPSQRATGKFFVVAGLLFLVHILNGGLLANYTVRPGQFYIQTVGQLYPYSWAKTWHVQLAIFWIAIAWVGTSIYAAPLIAGREAKGSRGLVNLLFAAVLVVVVGGLTGEVLSIKGLLGSTREGSLWYWLGHQGWEYLEMGRLWQIALLGGLVLWLVIVYRTMATVVTKRGEPDDDRRGLIIFYILSAILVVAFFGFGLFYGRGTHMTIADYWRWFVVHIWVESIFEFFGVAVIAMFLVTLGLVTAGSAIRVAYLTATLVFLGGIPGVAHHYFWYGGPSYWLAVGGIFSSLEPVPLIVLVVRALKEYKSIKDQGLEFPYKWPLYFLVASSFWNFLGAGVFGFIINLPIVNYYEHGTYLTANHAHTALFGTYGMMAVALMLFAWRALVETRHWNNRILKLSFWGMNVGLFLMFSTSLLPVGLLQISQTADYGVWYSRSAAFYEQPLVRAFGEWRIVPDSIIILFGAIPLLWFLASTLLKLRKPGEAGSEQ